MDKLRLRHKRRTVAFVPDARHGAAGVEVDGNETLERRCLARGEGEFVWVVSEDLAGDGPLAGKLFEEVSSGGRPVRERCGADHLGVREVGAELVCEFAEGGVSEVRERCEDEFHFTSKGSPSSRYESTSGSSLSLDEFRKKVEVNGTAVHLRCETGVEG